MGLVESLDDTYTKKVLATLRPFFKVWPYEKYPEAWINYLMSESCDKVLGKNFCKKKISQRKLKVLREEILSQARMKFGKWVNILQFKEDRYGRLTFSSNFGSVFGTERGHLYGSPFGDQFLENLLFTSHSLERFELRVDKNAYEEGSAKVYSVIKSEPTAADVLLSSILGGHFIYSPLGKGEDGCEEYRLLARVGNRSFGAVVVTLYGDFGVIKTFLSEDMAPLNKGEWYLPDVDHSTNKIPFMTFPEVFSCGRNSIKDMYKKDIQESTK